MDISIDNLMDILDVIILYITTKIFYNVLIWQIFLLLFLKFSKINLDI